MGMSKEKRQMAHFWRLDRAFVKMKDSKTSLVIAQMMVACATKAGR
jgi:hypothetical protein